MDISRNVKRMREHSFLLLLLLLSFVTQTVRADDTPVKNDSNYYEISTAAQLKWFAEQVNTSNPSINALLTADIDLSTLDDDYWTPIGNDIDGSSILFSGVFDGQNHVISGLLVRPCLHSGLFGYINGATIRNVVLEQPQFSSAVVNINRTNSFVGALCGNVTKSTIENCHVRNAVLVPKENADSQPLEGVGGICGLLNYSQISNSTASGYIESLGRYAGGIAALVHASQVDSCQLVNTSKGVSRIYAKKYAGGIAGDVRWRSADVCLVGCFNQHGQVEAADSTCGKIYGYEEFDTNQITTYNGYLEIYTADNLKLFAQYVNKGIGTHNARLMRDINMGQAGTFTPIGTEDHPFDGIFDGNGHTIDSLTINNQKYAGLFGYIKDGAVKNLTLTNPSLTTQDNDYLGFIAGLITQSSGHDTPVGYIENCHVRNADLARSGAGEPDCVGGIVGKADMSAAIRDCSFQGKIKAHEDYIGGIVGQMNSGSTIERSFIIGPSTVWGNDYVGGIVGYMTDTNTRMTDCYADQTNGTITLHASSGNYSGMLCGRDKSGTSGTNNTYTEDNLQYKLTGKQITVGGKSAHEAKITGVASAGKGTYYAIVDIGTSNNYFTTEIENADGVEELYFWDNNSNIAGTEACGWINMKIDDYAFGSSFKSLKMYYKVFAGTDHTVMLRPGDVRPAGDKMLANCPDAKVYVDAEYYDEFCNDSVWSKYKKYLVPVTWMRTEDVNAEYGARYAYDRNRDKTASVLKVDNGSIYGSSQVHIIGADDSYLNDSDHDNTLWIYQDIGQTYDFNTTKIWASSFKGKDNIKQVKFQEITKSADGASQDFCIAIGDSAFAKCKNLERFEVALYSNEGSDHAEYLTPSQLPIGKDVFAGSPNVRIYVPRDLIDEFKGDTKYGWAAYKDLIYEGSFGNGDWTEDGVIYSYYTSADGQTRYTNKYNDEMDAMLTSWNTEYRNFSPASILEYDTSNTIKYVFASGVVESKLKDGKLNIFSDIGECSPNHYKTLALSASGFQNKQSIKKICFEDIVANNYNTVTKFTMVIPDGTFSGCSNLKELDMFLYVTRGTNHYEAIKPSQVFIGEHVFDGVDPDFRIKVLPAYYNDFITDPNWSQYKGYIVASDYLPVDEKPITRNGITYDYATKVMNGLSTTELVAMKSSWWNVLTIGAEVAIAVATWGSGTIAEAAQEEVAKYIEMGYKEYGYYLAKTLKAAVDARHLAKAKSIVTIAAAKAKWLEKVTSYTTKAILAYTAATFGASLEVGAVLAGYATGKMYFNRDLCTPLNYIANRVKKGYERSETWAMDMDWVTTEQITNVPHMYVSEVEDRDVAIIYNDCGESNSDYQTVAVDKAAFHNKKLLEEVKFQERYGDGSRSLAKGMTLALPDSMFYGCTKLHTLNLVLYSTGAHKENHCYQALTPDNFVPMGDIFAGLDKSKIHIKVGKEALQEFLDDDYWAQYKDMFVTEDVDIVNKTTEWSCKYALAYDKHTLPLRHTVSTHDIDHVCIYAGDDKQLKDNEGLAALIQDFGEWNNYQLDYVKENAFKGNDLLKILDITDTHTNVADVYTDFKVALKDSAFAHCHNFTDLNFIFQVTDGIPNKTQELAPSQVTLGKGVFDDTPKLRIKFCLDQEDTFLNDTAWAKYQSKFCPCFFEPLDEKVGDILLHPYRFLTKLNDGTNFDHVDATRAKPEELKSLFKNTKIESFDEFRAFGTCGLDTVYNGMFSGCSSLQSITIPDSIRAIESDAFKDCSLLYSLTIPEKVTSIQANAFTGSAIKTFTVESSVPADIDASKAFAGLLDKDYVIYVTDSVADLYRSKWAAVADHINGISQKRGSLKVVTLKQAGTLAQELGLTYNYGSTISLSGNYAQYDSLRIIGPIDGRDVGVLRYMGGRDVEWANKTVGHLEYLDLYEAEIKSEGKYDFNRRGENYWIHDDNTVAGFMFSRLGQIKTLILPKTATKVQSYAFNSMDNLQNLVVGDNITSIGSRVINECYNISTVVMLPEKCPETTSLAWAIENEIFGDGNSNYRIETFIVPNGTATYSYQASIYSSYADTIVANFNDKAVAEVLKTKHIFSPLDFINVSNITGYFNGNTDIVKFSELYTSSITTLGDNTFTGASNLSEIILPMGLEKISGNAFDDCSSLRTIYADNSDVPTLDGNVFDKLPEDFVVYVLNGYENLYRQKWPRYENHIQGYRSNRLAVKEITLTEPNTLADSLKAQIVLDGTDCKAVNVDVNNMPKALKVNGPIGGKDLALIRYLAGREPYDNNLVYVTGLKYLDLYNAQLRADNYYFLLEGTDRKIEKDNEIPKDMLWNCDHLESVILPRTATKLSYEACYDMASLKRLVIGDDVTEIDNDALGDNRELDDLFLLCSSKPKLDGDAFTDPLEGDHRKVEHMYVRKSLVNDYSIDNEYTSHTSAITSPFEEDDLFRAFGSKVVATDDDLAEVYDVKGWFTGFTGITDLSSLAKTKITSLRASDVNTLPSLKRVSLPSTLTSIEDDAFAANTGLHWLDISACDSLTADVSKLGVTADALIYTPKSFGTSKKANVVYNNDGELRCARFNMADNRSYDVPKAFNTRKVVFARQYGVGEYSTLTLPFGAEHKPWGFTFYTIDTDSTRNGRLYFTPTSRLLGHRPYIVKSRKGGSIEINEETVVPETPYRATALRATAYTLTGNLEAIDSASAKAQKIMVMGDSTLWNFADSIVKPFTAYVQTNNVNIAHTDVPSEFGCEHYYMGRTEYDLEGDGSTDNPFYHRDVDFRDGTDFRSREPFYTNRATYSRDQYAMWSMLCLPYAIDANDSTNCEFYAIETSGTDEATLAKEADGYASREGQTGGQVTLTRLTGTIEAGRAIVVRQLTAGALSISQSGDEVYVSNAADSTGVMQGSFTETVVPKGKYVLSGNKFVLADDLSTDDVTLEPFHGYLSADALGLSGSSLDIVIDNTTAIRTLNDVMDDSAAEYYDVEGRRLNGLQKGLNIIRNGKKTVKVMIK